MIYEIEERQLSVGFPAANEPLQAIVEGMNARKGENILSILGSGDQPLTMIEKGAIVTAVDWDLSQVIYAKELIRLLKEGRYNEFLLPCGQADEWEEPFLAARHKYFSKAGRLDAIRSNLENLTIAESDICKMIKIQRWDKVYLSNAIYYIMNYCGMQNRTQRILEIFGDIWCSLNSSGLMYVSAIEDVMENIGAAKILGFKIDKELSEKAKQHYPKGLRLTPGVYRKAI